MVIPGVAPSSTTGFWRTTGFVTGAARAAGGCAAGVRATGDALRLARGGVLVVEVFFGRRVAPGLALVFLDFGDF
jgi:hypothetical protein